MKHTFVIGSITVALLASAVSAPSAFVETELVTLMIGMAVIKGALLLAAAAVLYWRLGQPCTRAIGLSYCIGMWLAVASTVWIAALSHLALSAVLFHLGGLGILVTAWRDDGLTLLRSKPLALTNDRRAKRAATPDEVLVDLAEAA